MPLSVAIRTATAEDARFAYLVRETTMREYVVSTWGEWVPGQVREQIDQDIRERRLKVVEIGAQAAGVMRVDELATHIHVDQLFLLPAHQRQGVGETLVRGILETAMRKRIPVRLWVLRVNPARRLYERLGFTVIEETPASLHLERCARAHEEVDTRGKP
jgi:GNAT superfamily N-acetyltransferase